MVKYIVTPAHRYSNNIFTMYFTIYCWQELILTPSMSLVHQCSLKEATRNSWISCICGEVKFVLQSVGYKIYLWIYLFHGRCIWRFFPLTRLLKSWCIESRKYTISKYWVVTVPWRTDNLRNTCHSAHLSTIIANLHYLHMKLYSVSKWSNTK
jgi:hypothetical protein